MSVPVSKRSISALEFYNTAVNIRVELSRWLLRDFGIKNKIKRADVVAKAAHMKDEDKEIFLSILGKYGLTEQLSEDYPSWWITERRKNIDTLCSHLLSNIRAANAIYPTSEQEYWERRLFQNKAIGIVEALEEELQFTVTILHTTLGVDVNKYLPFAEALERELMLLKAWRKSDNRILKQIKSKLAKESQK